MVILVHSAQKVDNLSRFASSIAEYGQMGVQLFFVTSAYTLCLSAERRNNEPAKLISFYLRRLFRIAPLYYFGIITYLVAYLALEYHHAGIIDSFGPYTPLNVLVNGLFLHGLVPQANNNIVPGGWSIGTEMLFYLIFPVIYKVGAEMAEKWSFLGIIYLLAIAASVNFLIQLALSGTALAIQNNNFMYFGILNQLPVFMAGIAAYFYSRKVECSSASKAKVVSVSGFCAFTGITLMAWHMKITILFAVVPLTVGISFSFLINYLRITKYNLGPLRRIGRVSYSMYICHFLFAWYIVPAVIPLAFGSINAASKLILSFALSASMAYVCALITERAIEKTGIDLGRRIVRIIQLRSAALPRQASSAR